MGTAAVSDQCTIVGTKLINPVITLPPNGLSTWKPPVNQWAYEYDNFTIGEIWNDPSNQFEVPIEAGIKQLDLKDLACPTWGLGKSTAVNGTVITTIGPPWLPLIVPPFNLFSLDPKWAAECTGLFSDQFELTTFALFDPPIALTPAIVLASTPLVLPTRTPADPTTIPDPAKSSSKAAKPASIPNDPVAAPAKTENPAIPSQSPVIDPSDPGPLPNSPAASTKNEVIAGDLPAESITPSSSALDPPSGDSQKWPSNTKIPPSSAVPGDAPVGPIAPSSSAVDPPSGDLQQPASDPKMPIPVPIQGGNTQAQTQGLGAIIYNAFWKSRPDDNGAKGAVDTVPLSPQSIFAIGAQTFTANPTGFNIGNTVISPGDAAHTVDGTSISLDKSGVLAIGSSTVSLTNPLTTVSVAAGQTFIPNPSAFSIAGTTISPDGPAITVSGTVVSLDHSGALRIDNSITSLASPPDPPPSKVYTIAGKIFTPNPSAFSIANSIVSAGGPAATIDGTIISLGQSGALVIGSSTVNLPTQFHTPYNKAYTIAGQTFTPNPSAFSIASTTISAGGPAVTIDGTIITIQPSGTLLLGSSTIIPLLKSHSTFSSDNDITIDGLQIEAQQSSFLVVGDGVTLSAGASGVSISGTVVRLESGGETLDVDGTGRFALPTPPPLIKGSNGSESSNVQAFTGGQGRGFSASSMPLLLLLLCGIWGVVMFGGVGVK